MDIKTEKRNNILIISLTGLLDSSNYMTLDEKIQTFIKDGAHYIIFNLENLEYLSSSGIRVFIKTHNSLKPTGGSMAFSGLKPFVLEIFDIAGISSGFKIYQDIDTAYKSFNS